MNRDDRVLGTTGALGGFIAPFLLVAFILLHGLPGQTARLWARRIRSHPTTTPFTDRPPTWVLGAGFVAVGQSSPSWPASPGTGRRLATRPPAEQY
ncbi:hypothetical protein [Intrasporangium sp.]|uniref:hypothetical protein n=1 Tax=Intrasporangium sp. TaxID=1925024 RepID=UPI0032220E7D